MRHRDNLERARRLAARRGDLTGVVRLFHPDLPDDADWGEVWKTVDLADHPPGPARDALMEGAVVMTGTHDDWVLEESRRAEP